MSLAGIAANSKLVLVILVFRGDPFHSSVLPGVVTKKEGTKPLPFT
jgi:hypothetical protein